LVQSRQRDFGIELQQVRLEAALGQATLQRHLTAFKAHLVVATGTGFLAFVTTASGLAQARTDTTANAALGMLGAVCGLDAIEFHDLSLRRF
jgi:hypothetical protein